MKTIIKSSLLGALSALLVISVAMKEVKDKRDKLTKEVNELQIKLTSTQYQLESFLYYCIDGEIMKVGQRYYKCYNISDM